MIKENPKFNRDPNNISNGAFTDIETKKVNWSEEKQQKINQDQEDFINERKSQVYVLQDWNEEKGKSGTVTENHKHTIIEKKEESSGKEGDKDQVEESKEIGKEKKAAGIVFGFFKQAGVGIAKNFSGIKMFESWKTYFKTRGESKEEKKESDNALAAENSGAKALRILKEENPRFFLDKKNKEAWDDHFKDMSPEEKEKEISELNEFLKDTQKEKVEARKKATEKYDTLTLEQKKKLNEAVFETGKFGAFATTLFAGGPIAYAAALGRALSTPMQGISERLIEGKKGGEIVSGAISEYRKVWNDKEMSRWEKAGKFGAGAATVGGVGWLSYIGVETDDFGEYKTGFYRLRESIANGENPFVGMGDSIKNILNKDSAETVTSDQGFGDEDAYYERYKADSNDGFEGMKNHIPGSSDEGYESKKNIIEVDPSKVKTVGYDTPLENPTIMVKPDDTLWKIVEKNLIDSQLYMNEDAVSLTERKAFLEAATKELANNADGKYGSYSNVNEINPGQEINLEKLRTALVEQGIYDQIGIEDIKTDGEQTLSVNNEKVIDTKASVRANSEFWKWRMELAGMSEAEISAKNTEISIASGKEIQTWNGKQLSAESINEYIPEKPVTVEKGDSIWKIMQEDMVERQLTKMPPYADLLDKTKYPEHIVEARKTYLTDLMKDHIVANHSEYGLKGNNVDCFLQINDTIDLQKVALNTLTLDEFTKVEKIGDATAASIKQGYGDYQRCIKMGPVCIEKIGNSRTEIVVPIEVKQEPKTVYKYVQKVVRPVVNPVVYVDNPTPPQKQYIQKTVYVQPATSNLKFTPGLRVESKMDGSNNISMKGGTRISKGISSHSYVRGGNNIDMGGGRRVSRGISSYSHMKSNNNINMSGGTRTSEGIQSTSSINGGNNINMSGGTRTSEGIQSTSSINGGNNINMSGGITTSEGGGNITNTQNDGEGGPSRQPARNEPIQNPRSAPTDSDSTTSRFNDGEGGSNRRE